MISRKNSLFESFYPVKFFDTSDDLTWQFEVPGFEKEDIVVTRLSDYIKIKARNDFKVFERLESLPPNAGELSASLRNGILTVKADKIEEKPIEIIVE